VEEGDERELVDLLETDLDEDVASDSKAFELLVEGSLEEVPTETDDEQSYPDPDYLPLPDLLLGPSSPSVFTEIPLVLVEDGPPNNSKRVKGTKTTKMRMCSSLGMTGGVVDELLLRCLHLLLPLLLFLHYALKV
jgi:hypothetical protein